MQYLVLKGYYSGEILNAIGYTIGEILASEVNDDYQGNCKYLIKFHDSRYALAEWSWGSCEYCDEWSTLSPLDLKIEAQKCVSFFDNAEVLRQYIDNCKNTHPDTWLKDVNV